MNEDLIRKPKDFLELIKRNVDTKLLLKSLYFVEAFLVWILKVYFL